MKSLRSVLSPVILDEEAGSELQQQRFHSPGDPFESVMHTWSPTLLAPVQAVLFAQAKASLRHKTNTLLAEKIRQLAARKSRCFCTKW